MTDDPDAFRSEVRAFLEAHFERRGPRDRVSVLGAGAEDAEALATGRAFLETLAERGYAVPGWPREHGGSGATPEEAAIVAEEMSRVETPDLYPFGVGLSLVGPTVLTHGTEEQRARWLAPIARGEEIWCQLFSEPGAGSDLAGLATRAERDGDGWRVSGQKVWSSRAQYADRGLLLARTDASVPKHAGITAFALDMRSEGVEVRPLRQMNGDTHFNEVFLDGAFVADVDRIDEPGRGWSVARTTLGHERGAFSGGGFGGLSRGQVLEMVRSRGARSDPVARDRAVDLVARMHLAGLAVRRARDLAGAGADVDAAAAGAGSKIRLADELKDLGGLAVGLLGPAGVAGDALGDDWTTVFLTAPSVSIRGGTDEIQRDVIGDRVLGLPREPRVDKDPPFDELPRS